MAMSLGTARPRSFARLARPSSTPASHHPLLLCFRRKVYSMELLHDSGSPPTMTISYLDKLNPQQSRAVEHGGSALAKAGPLLIIAGAGSGKTNTLAHRVAHLIVNGADPRRIMLLTFSRRAAAEMMRRERIHEDAAVRQRDLVQLAQIASGYSSRERFLTELTLDLPDSTSDQAGVPRLDEDYLILSTIHSAKGQEWKSVFLLNTVDGCLPSDLATGTVAEIEEERRLLYVAMTRAKDNLHLIVPQRFFAHLTSTSKRSDRYQCALASNVESIERGSAASLSTRTS